MKKISRQTIFLALGVFFILILNLLVAFAIFGLISINLIKIIVIIFTCLVVFSLSYLLLRRLISFDKKFILIIVLLLVLTCLNIIFSHDIARGRDEAGYYSAAAKLIETGSLSFEDKIAKTFSPFREIRSDLYTSQFYPAYITYLAALQALTSKWTVVGNSILILLALFIFWALAKRLGGSKLAYVFILIFSSSYFYFWFPRKLLSENLSLTTFWFAVLLFIIFYQSKEIQYLALSFYLASFLLLIRAEGFVFTTVFLLLLIIFSFGSLRKCLAKVSYIIFLLLGLANIFLFWQYNKVYQSTYFVYAYKNIFKFFDYLSDFWLAWLVLFLVIVISTALIIYLRSKTKLRKYLTKDYLKRYILIIILISAFIFEVIYYSQLSLKNIVDWSTYKFQFLLEIFNAYHLLLLVILGLIFYLFYHLPKSFYLVLLLSSPAFTFLINPSIGVDQPWFMRRFYPIIVPLIFLFFAYGLIQIVKTKKQWLIVGGLLLLFNLQLSLPLLSFRENHGVSQQLADWAQDYTDEDLIFFSPGWHWQQWAYAWHFLYGLEVVPDLKELSPAEIKELITAYDQVYIMVAATEDQFPYYDSENLTWIKDWQFIQQELKSTVWVTTYVTKEARHLTKNFIRRSQQGTPPKEFETITLDFKIYQVINPELFDYQKLETKED